MSFREYLKSRISPAARHRIRQAVGVTWNQWVREVMDRETRSFVTALHPENLEALEVSGNYWKDFGFRSFDTVKFPEFDLCGDNVPAEKWDIILLEQVLEHVLYPGKAVENLRRMLKPGGHLVVTTPFLIRIHPDPFDCNRWTETGMKYLLHECGFEFDEIQTGSWGNRSCVIRNLEHWPTYNRFKFHSLRNDPRYPVSVWAFARKSA